MSTSISFPIFASFSIRNISPSGKNEVFNGVVDKYSDGKIDVKSRAGKFSDIPSWVNAVFKKRGLGVRIGNSECYKLCVFKSKSGDSFNYNDVFNVLNRKRALSSVTEEDDYSEDDDENDSDYVPSDSEERDDDHEFDENVVSEPEDNEPGTEPEDDILTDGDYESDPEENLRFIARKAIKSAKAKRAEPTKQVSMKRVDLMTSRQFTDKINEIVNNAANRTHIPVPEGRMAPRRSVRSCAGGMCRQRYNRAPYNSPLINSLSQEDMNVVNALVNLRNATTGPRMEVIELEPAAATSIAPNSIAPNKTSAPANKTVAKTTSNKTAPLRRSARIANKK
jgi:hypothetical protein